jgi:hypothetical protein
MATGLFNLKQVMQAVQQGGWPAQRTPSVEYLVVAGGGGGSYFGAGGAGGLLTGIDPVPNGQTLLVTVGAGGTGTTGNSDNTTQGAASVFGSISASGGGAGFLNYVANASKNNGGSGGGGGYSNSPPGESIFGNGIVGQGNAGGKGTSTYNSGGGGGGAGTIGLTSASSAGTNGGAGIASAISGTVTTYAGGGGSGGGTASGSGGVGGGGAGGNGAGTATGTAGTVNTGGGGGGAANNSSTGGAGGSGIVIVSYPDVYAAATATTGSPTVSTSGSGSVLLNGTSQFLSVTSSSNFAFGTGDFTVEGWFYQTSDNTYPTALEIGAHINATGALFVTKYSGVACIYSGGFVGSTATTLNAWNHIAWVRSSGVLQIYVNGVGGTSAAFTNNLTDTSTVTIGKSNLNTAGYYYPGNTSNLRVVKGTAVYTSNFTPSTRPLTAITNTQLLMNTVSGAPFADSSANSYSPTSTTPPTWNASSPFTVTGYKNRVYTWTSSGSITF